MKVTKRDSEQHTKDVIFESGSKTLSFLFAGTGDLHWILKNNDIREDDDNLFDYFYITRENSRVYDLFNQLFIDLKTINIFDKSELEFPYYIETDEEKRDYLKELEMRKLEYKTLNVSNYNELYDEKTDTITWYSDETAHEVCNILKIRKIGDRFRIEFYTQPYIKGYDRECNLLGTIGIRFRNSGSRYDPFNIVFMRMFDGLQKVDDINDFGHQWTIDEFLYMNNQPSKNITSSDGKSYIQNLIEKISRADIREDLHKEIDAGVLPEYENILKEINLDMLSRKKSRK